MPLRSISRPLAPVAIGARGVRAHHERWDGGGYPDGIAGEAIPLAARIVCVCDAFNAMTTNRSYRPAMPAADALAELRACSGTQFDPAVVDAIERVRPGRADAGRPAASWPGSRRPS